MNRLFRRWKLLLALLVLLPLLLLGIAQLIVSMVVTPAWVVRKIEASKNCQASIGSVSVNLWSIPASLEVKDVKLIPRTADADAGKPLKERANFELGETGLTVQNAVVTVDLFPLLVGKISVKNVTLAVVNINTLQLKSGGNTLQSLMESPAIVEGKAVVQPPAAQETKDTGTPKPARKDFNVADLPSLPTLDKITIEHLRVNIRSEKRKELLKFEDWLVTLSDFRIDKNNLAEKNHLKLELQGRFLVLGRKGKVPEQPDPDVDNLGRIRHANLSITASTDVVPFDPQNGKLSNLAFELVFQKGSRLKGVPALQKISKKMKDWSKYGLRLDPLPDEGTLLADAKIKLAFGADKLAFAEDASVQLDSYTMDVAAGSWAHFADNECDLKTRFTANEEISQKALSDLRVSLVDKAGEKIGGKLADQIGKNERLFKDGRLSISLPISGDLSNPEVDDSVVVNLIKDLVLGSVLDALSNQ